MHASKLGLRGIEGVESTMVVVVGGGCIRATQQAERGDGGGAAKEDLPAVHYGALGIA